VKSSEHCGTELVLGSRVLRLTDNGLVIEHPACHCAAVIDRRWERILGSETIFNVDHNTTNCSVHTQTQCSLHYTRLTIPGRYCKSSVSRSQNKGTESTTTCTAPCASADSLMISVC